MKFCLKDAFRSLLLHKESDFGEKAYIYSVLVGCENSRMERRVTTWLTGSLDWKQLWSWGCPQSKEQGASGGYSGLLQRLCPGCWWEQATANNNSFLQLWTSSLHGPVHHVTMSLCLFFLMQYSNIIIYLMPTLDMYHIHLVLTTTL